MERMFYTFEDPSDAVTVYSVASLPVIEGIARAGAFKEFWTTSSEGVERHHVWFDGKFRVEMPVVTLS